MPYSLLNTTVSLPMMLGPRAQALSYHVPTKLYPLLPNSQAQSLEMPFPQGLLIYKRIPMAHLACYV